MDLTKFLSHYKISLDEVLTQADAAVHLSRGDVLFISGSLVEGLGNDRSDLDLFLITSRTDIQFTSLNDVTVIVGDCVVDIRVVQRSAIQGLLERFSGWVGRPRQPRAAFEFAEDERKLLHRLLISRPLFGEAELEGLKANLDPRDLARHKLDWARHMAATIQVDLAGLHSDGDCHSMLLAAQELLGYTIDGLLAAYGNTNPTLKWRVRLLEGLPADWERRLPGRPANVSPGERFMSLHRAPQSFSLDAVYDYALQIVAFSRCIFPWAESELLGGKPLSIPPLNAVALPASPSDGESLPHLGLDVVIRFEEGRFDLSRLNVRGQTFELSPQAYLLLCLFDGVTSKKAAADYAEKLELNKAGKVIVEGLMTMARHARLEAAPVIDEQTLRAILHR